MKKHLLRSLIILIGLAFVSIGAARAHGAAVIAVQPDVVAAGGEITVTGTEMEAGETFAITLEGIVTSITLGTATATPNEAGGDTRMKVTPEAESKATAESESTAGGEAAEGGFRVTFTIPEETAPGSYIETVTQLRPT